MPQDRNDLEGLKKLRGSRFGIRPLPQAPWRSPGILRRRHAHVQLSPRRVLLPDSRHHCCPHHVEIRRARIYADICEDACVRRVVRDLTLSMRLPYLRLPLATEDLPIRSQSRPLLERGLKHIKRRHSRNYSRHCQACCFKQRLIFQFRSFTPAIHH